MKIFCTSLREHAANVTDFEKIKILSLTKTELRLHQDVTTCYICRKILSKRFAKDKNYRKVRDHCCFTCKYRGAADSICNLKLNVPSEIPVVFHNVSNYDYHFIIKELANQFEGQFECLGENKKVKKLFPFQYKKKLEKLIKMVMGILQLFLT